jgi:hypothetical protein
MPKIKKRFQLGLEHTILLLLIQIIWKCDNVCIFKLGVGGMTSGPWESVLEKGAPDRWGSSTSRKKQARKTLKDPPPVEPRSIELGARHGRA